MRDAIDNIVTLIRRDNPLILNITNDVTMDFIANGLLSLGASPVMSNANEELEELIHLSAAVVINIGTLDDKFISLCRCACKIANRLNKPIVFDPVGAGASQYRSLTCQQLMSDYLIAIIRGNASEIMSLAGFLSASKGVDSLVESHQASESAKLLSEQYDSTIFVSGKTDLIISQNRIDQFNYGSSMMPRITGSGCLLSAVVAAFHAVESDSFKAACSAAIYYGRCGEMAEKTSKRPGSFKPAFIDALSTNWSGFDEKI